MRFGLRRPTALPEALRRSLAADERVLAAARIDDGAGDSGAEFSTAGTSGQVVIAATRFGLWTAREDSATRVEWHRVSRARLVGGVLHLTVADEVGTWPDGTVLLRDRAETALRPQRQNKVTDVVHDRVRASVVAARQITWSGSCGWVVLRKIAGRDGLTVQLRLDRGADPDAAGLAEAVETVVTQLWPSDTPRNGRVSADGE